MKNQVKKIVSLLTVAATAAMAAMPVMAASKTLNAPILYSSENVMEIAEETTGTFQLGDVFAFLTSQGKPTAYRVDNHNVIYTDRGVTVTTGNNHSPDDANLLASEGVGTVTGTVFESLGNNTTIYRITNTDDTPGDARWYGWIDMKTAVNKPGVYRISLLGNASNRGFKVICGGKTVVSGNISSGTGIISADAVVTEEDIADDGTVTFRVTGNENCPNIYAIHIDRVNPKINWNTTVDSVKVGKDDTATGTLRFLAAAASSNGYDFSKGEYGFVFVNFEPGTVTNDYMGETTIDSFTGEADTGVQRTVVKIADSGLQKNQAFYVDIENIPVTVDKIGLYAVPYVVLEDGDIIYGTPFTAKEFKWVTK